MLPRALLACAALALLSSAALAQSDVYFVKLGASGTAVAPQIGLSQLFPVVTFTLTTPLPNNPTFSIVFPSELEYTSAPLAIESSLSSPSGIGCTGAPTITPNTALAAGTGTKTFACTLNANALNGTVKLFFNGNANPPIKFPDYSVTTSAYAVTLNGGTTINVPGTYIPAGAISTGCSDFSMALKTYTPSAATSILGAFKVVTAIPAGGAIKLKVPNGALSLATGVSANDVSASVVITNPAGSSKVNISSTSVVNLNAGVEIVTTLGSSVNNSALPNAVVSYTVTATSTSSPFANPSAGTISPVTLNTYYDQTHVLDSVSFSWKIATGFAGNCSGYVTVMVVPFKFTMDLQAFDATSKTTLLNAAKSALSVYNASSRLAMNTVAAGSVIAKVAILPPTASSTAASATLASSLISAAATSGSSFQTGVASLNLDTTYTSVATQALVTQCSDGSYQDPCPPPVTNYLCGQALCIRIYPEAPASLATPLVGLTALLAVLLSVYLL